MPRAAFLESLAGSLSLFTRGLLSGARASGWETHVEPLRAPDGSPRRLDDLRSTLTRLRADTIAFLMDAPLGWPDLWDTPALSPIPKVSLWFDDFLRSPRTLAGGPTWAVWQRRFHVQAFIWDGHWRSRWLALTGSPAHAIHLAADPADFDPAAPPAFPALAHRAVFVGTIPARAALDADADALPPFLRGEIADLAASWRSATWPLRPYDDWDARIDALPARRAAAARHWLGDPAHAAVASLHVWREAKRSARLRGLSAAASAGPLAILSGHRSEPFAREDELRAALPPGADLVFHDTTGLPPDRWSGLFRSGHIQLQVTDPQSIEGGLPFRVFECAACARPLLADSRPELAGILPDDARNRLLADDDADLATRTRTLLATPAGDIAALGSQLHQDFLARHTWAHRWREITRAR